MLIAMATSDATEAMFSAMMLSVPSNLTVPPASAAAIAARACRALRVFMRGSPLTQVRVHKGPKMYHLFQHLLESAGLSRVLQPDDDAIERMLQVLGLLACERREVRYVGEH